MDQNDSKNSNLHNKTADSLTEIINETANIKFRCEDISEDSNRKLVLTSTSIIVGNLETDLWKIFPLETTTVNFNEYQGDLSVKFVNGGDVKHSLFLDYKNLKEFLDIFFALKRETRLDE